MSKHVTVGFLIAIAVHAAAAKDAVWTLTDPVRGTHKIFIEAERMTAVTGWQNDVIGYADTHPHKYSRGKLAADASDEPALARIAIDVPAAGSYNLWVHYDAVAAFDTTFAVEVSQGQEHRGGAQFGGKDQLRWVPWGHGWAVHHKNWDWHHADPSWQKMRCDLAAGPAVVSLAKGGDSGAHNGAHGAWRFVDCLILTDALADEPANQGGTLGFLDCSTETTSVYVKLTAPPALTEPAAVRCVLPQPHQRPYYKFWSGFLTAAGHVKTVHGNVASRADQRLAAGQATPWIKVPIRPMAENRLVLTAESGDLGGFEVALALGPAGEPAGRDIAMPAGQRQLILQMTRDPDRPEEIMTLDEIAARYTAVLAALDCPGRKPVKFLDSITMWGFREGLMTKALLRQAGMSMVQAAAGTFTGNAFADLGFSAHFLSSRFAGDLRNLTVTDADREAFRKQLQAQQRELAEAAPERVPVVIKSTDEPSARSLSFMATRPWFNEAFRDYAKALGLKPLALLPQLTRKYVEKLPRETAELSDEAVWPYVRIGTEEDRGNAVLYYHSQLFRARAFTDFFAESLKLQREVFGERLVGAFINQSPGHMYNTGWWHATDYADLVRRGGQSIVWSESWHRNLPFLVTWTDAAMVRLMHGAIRGVDGAAVGNHVVMTQGRGIPPASALACAAVTVAHGSRLIDWYCEFPTGNLDGPVQYQDEMLLAIKRFNFALGEIEDLLLDSTLHQPRIALLWAKTTAIYDELDADNEMSTVTPVVNAYSQEFIHLTAALAQAGFAVDVLMEDDVANGVLADYAVFYMACDQLRADAAKRIAAWVNAGGVLYATAGGGLKDEYNRPNGELLPVYGIDDQVLRRVVPGIKHRATLAELAPLDQLQPTNDLPPLAAYCFLQTFGLAGGKSLATTLNGKEVLAVDHAYGQGRATIVGTLPGVAMMKPAFPDRLYARSIRDDDLHSFDPTEFDAGARDWITFAARQAGVRPDAVCDPAHIEAVVRETATHYLICLINHAPETAVPVSVSFAPELAIGTVRSQQSQTTLPVVDGRVQLSISAFDFLVAERPGP